jgi:uncharacterized delta-60 repeat protein
MTSSNTPPTFGSTGTLDAGFGTDGIAVTDLGAGYDSAIAVAVADDGGIVVAANRYDGSDNRLVLLRYAADGRLDAGFGANGVVATDFQQSGGAAWDLAVQADGKILVAGDYFNGRDYDFALARYNADGSPDAGFGTGGLAITALGSSDDSAAALAVQADGGIVVVGQSYWLDNDNFAVVRYLPDGSLDPRFSGDGRVVTDFRGAGDGATAMAVQPDGKLLVAGRSYNGANDDFALARYNADGSLDTLFGSGGGLTTDIQKNDDIAFAVALQSDGKIVVAGRSSGGQTAACALARYNADGSLDTGFGSRGLAVTSLVDSARRLVIRADGKIVAAGSANGDFALVRFTADGKLDTGFGKNGLVTTEIGMHDDLIADLALQADGRLVAAGQSYTGLNDDIVLVRYGWETALPSQQEDGWTPGATVGSLFAPVFVDADGDALAGIAVTADLSAARQGQWQYSTDGGTAWHGLGAVSASQALLLGADAELRFLPAPDYSGTPGALTVHLVDSSGAFAFSVGAVRRTLDTAGTASAVSIVSTSLSVIVTPVNDAPTLSVFAALTDAVEDRPFTFDYGRLAAAGDAADADGDALVFRIEAVTAGTLVKNGQGIVAGVTTLSPGETLVWTPPANAHGGLAAFTVTAVDPSGAASFPAVPVTIQVAAVNDAPTLTAVTPLAGAVEDQPYTIRYDDLAAAADEADLDGDALAFRIEGVTAGTLTKNGQPAIPGNTTLSPGETLAWTPPVNAYGNLTAFTVAAIDPALAVSQPPAPVTIRVDAVNDPPVLGAKTAVVGYREGGPPVKPYPDLAVADVDHARLAGATVILTDFRPLDLLAADTAGTAVRANYDRSTGTLSLIGADTPAAYQSVLRTLRFTTAEDLTAPGRRHLQLAVTDGVSSSRVLASELSLAPSVIVGTEARDLLVGTGANDLLKGLGGNDLLDGKAGADRLLGGAGDDTYVVDNPLDSLVESVDAGIDTVRASVSWKLAGNLENLALIGNGNLAGTGNALNNRLVGNAGDNTLEGRNGKDLLIGGLGKDVLSGGAGADSFRYGGPNESPVGAGRDLIVDFSRVAGDRIDLRALDANSLAGGDQAFAFIGARPFTAAGQLRYQYDAASGSGILSGDVNGDRQADFEIELIKVKSLGEMDFFL